MAKYVCGILLVFFVTTDIVFGQTTEDPDEDDDETPDDFEESDFANENETEAFNPKDFTCTGKRIGGRRPTTRQVCHNNCKRPSGREVSCSEACCKFGLNFQSCTRESKDFNSRTVRCKCQRKP